jgi:hypothetical protein
MLLDKIDEQKALLDDAKANFDHINKIGVGSCKMWLDKYEEMDK